MAGIEYENWDDVHYCPTPPIGDVAGKRSLKPGGEWTCPDCGAVHVVARVDRTSVRWISFGRGRATYATGGYVPGPGTADPETEGAVAREQQRQASAGIGGEAPSDQ